MRYKIRFFDSGAERSEALRFPRRKAERSNTCSMFHNGHVTLFQTMKKATCSNEAR